MPRGSKEWLHSFLARGANAQRAVDEVLVAAKGIVRQQDRLESDLHRAILSECGRRSLVTFHGRMDRKSGRTLGEPDFTILLPGSRVLLVECKRPGQKRSAKQEEIFVRAKLLGHHIHLVTTFPAFVEVLDAELRAGAYARRLSQPLTNPSHEVQS